MAPIPTEPASPVINTSIISIVTFVLGSISGIIRPIVSQKVALVCRHRCENPTRGVPGNIFKTKAKQMELRTLYLASRREGSMKKKRFESKPPFRGQPLASPSSPHLRHPRPTSVRQFWDTFRAELADKSPYKASIGGMDLRLPELQESDQMAQKIRAEELQEGWEDIDGVLHHQDLPFMPEVI